MISFHKASCTHHTYTVGLPPENKGQYIYIFPGFGAGLVLTMHRAAVLVNSNEQCGKRIIYCSLVFLGSYFRSLEV